MGEKKANKPLKKSHPFRNPLQEVAAVYSDSPKDSVESSPESSPSLPSSIFSVPNSFWGTESYKDVHLAPIYRRFLKGGQTYPNEISPDKEESVKDLFLCLQQQVHVMSTSLSNKLDQLQCSIQCDRYSDTNVALQSIRNQLHQLTRSMESCQTEVSEVKRDMVVIKAEIDSLQAAKEEIEELRGCVDKLEEQQLRRKRVRFIRQGLTCFLSYAILAAVLGMFQFGYNTGVINAPQRVIQKFFKDVYHNRYGYDIEETTNDLLWSLAVSLFAIGGMTGGFFAGYIANRFGRKGGLLMNNVLGIAGGILMGFAKTSASYEMMIFGRLIVGINCGVNTTIVPMYISEIAPLTLRGGLGVVSQLAATIGLLLSQILGIEKFLGSRDGWNYLLGIAVCPAILQLVLLPVCPESPRFLLLNRKQEEEAKKALQRLRASAYIEDDLEDMKLEEIALQSESPVTILELLRSSTLRLPLIIAVMMQLSQQLSGINAVFYYSTDMFMTAGLLEDHARYATIGVGAVMLVMIIITIPLIDRIGRRNLHLYGLGGMFIFSIFITISLLVRQMIEWVSYLSVVSTLIFVVFFAVGPGAIPWMITAELFGQGPRPAAMSIAVLVNWFSNFVVGIGFLQLQVLLENYTFLLFSLFLGIFWIFTYKKVPETKNKTFEEISALFMKKPSGNTYTHALANRDIPFHENSALILETGIASFQSSPSPVSSSSMHHLFLKDQIMRRPTMNEGTV